MSLPCFRRRIDIATQGNTDLGSARVALEDDFHHFRVALEMKNNRVWRAEGEALRTPYTLCGEACSSLQRLEGMPLTTSSNDIYGYTDPQHQCTHLFDEAGLGIAAASRGISRRRYDIVIPRHIDECTSATLYCDGLETLHWEVEDLRVTGGAAQFIGLDLGKGMSRWVQQNLDEELAEAALILRRCCMISRGRTVELDKKVHAEPLGFCYSQQPSRASQALRVVGSTLDFTADPEKLCASDQEWLVSCPA